MLVRLKNHRWLGMSRAALRYAIWLLVSLGVSACDDETILIQEPMATNAPPRIVAQGPELPEAPISLRAFDDGPELFVVVSDPDGTDDIAAVYLEYDSLIVDRMIVRRANQEDGCRGPVYADFDTLAMEGILPEAIRGEAFVPMRSAGAGAYMSPAFSTLSHSFLSPPEECDLFPGFENASPYFAFIPCIDGTEWVWAFVLLPPLVTEARTVFITEAEVQYAGLSVVAVDGHGLSDTVSFSNLRVIHTTNTERSVAP